VFFIQENEKRSDTIKMVLENGDISNSNLCKPSIAENITMNYDIL